MLALKVVLFVAARIMSALALADDKPRPPALPPALRHDVGAPIRLSSHTIVNNVVYPARLADEYAKYADALRRYYESQSESLRNSNPYAVREDG